MTSILDEARVEAFAGRLLSTYTSAMVTYMVAIGHRTGLFEALAAGPGRSQDLADRAGLTERYVREWLGAVTTAGIVDYDPPARTYTLPAEHALCLTGEGSLNVAPMSHFPTLLARHVEGVARSFRDGGGIPYEQFRPDFTSVMDAANRSTFDGQLLTDILPLAGDLTDRLSDGIHVADIGCGTGHALNLMARAYPASQFVGYDISVEAVEKGRQEAREYAVSNVCFEVMDVANLSADPPFHAIFAFDAIHDQVDPAAVLANARAALAPGGVFVMMDIKASSHLEQNLDNPLAPLLYATSTLHCITVSLAEGGAGLGTMWGRELALSMLADAGFATVEVHDVPNDPFNSVYLAR